MWETVKFARENSFIHIVAIHYKEGFFLLSKLSRKGGGWELFKLFNKWELLKFSGIHG
jgi:hypothetical protein